MEPYPIDVDERSMRPQGVRKMHFELRLVYPPPNLKVYLLFRPTRSSLPLGAQ